MLENRSPKNQLLPKKINTDNYSLVDSGGKERDISSVCFLRILGNNSIFSGQLKPVCG